MPQEFIQIQGSVEYVRNWIKHNYYRWETYLIDAGLSNHFLWPSKASDKYHGITEPSAAGRPFFLEEWGVSTLAALMLLSKWSLTLPADSSKRAKLLLNMIITSGLSAADLHWHLDLDGDAADVNPRWPPDVVRASGLNIIIVKGRAVVFESFEQALPAQLRVKFRRCAA
eukprot:3775268-Lingulodinium_polyedra.AAC.1